MSATKTNWQTVIGLETHIQLHTNSKAFCSDSATFGAAPNTHISAISLGHPGTLPRLNKRQIEYAVRLGLALGCKINETSFFDRKNYFYTDLPKGYQITQDRQPICVGGYVPIRLKDGTTRNVRLHHIHMEEDAGKSIHDLSPKHSMIDLNRAGVPLLEIVSDPDLYSAEEVDAYMNTLRQLVRWLDISDGNMEQGSFRCDVNISIRPEGSETYGQRCEIKNMNSIRNARNAISYEVKRQIRLIESGGEVQQNTLQYDPAKGTTRPLRSKENAHDYRYFPDPDLPPVVLSDAFIEKIKSEMPALPWTLYERFTTEYNLSNYDATILTEERNIAYLMVDIAAKYDHKKAIANLLINKVRPYLSEQNALDQAIPISAEHFVDLLRLMEEQKISASNAYAKLLPEMWKQPTKKVSDLVQALNLLQSADDGDLESLVDKVLADNPAEVAKYKKGKKNLIGFFMGQVKKASKGKANPKATSELLREKLAR